MVANICGQEWSRMRSSSGERRSLILQSWLRSEPGWNGGGSAEIFEGGNGMAVRIHSGWWTERRFLPDVPPVLVIKALILKIRHLVVHVSYWFVRVLRGKVWNGHPGLRSTPPRSEFAPHYLGTSLILEKTSGTKICMRTDRNIYDRRSLMELYWYSWDALEDLICFSRHEGKQGLCKGEEGSLSFCFPKIRARSDLSLR